MSLGFCGLKKVWFVRSSKLIVKDTGEYLAWLHLRKKCSWKISFSCCFIVTIIVAGADPTLKDDLGHTAMEYAGSEKIKEFLSSKMELVWMVLCNILFTSFWAKQ